MFSLFSKKKKPLASVSGELREFVRQTAQYMLEGVGNTALDDIQITKQGQAVVVLSGRPGAAHRDLSSRMKTEIEKITGIEKATVVITGEKSTVPQENPVSPEKNPDVPHIIAVSSGKGGVGKSTVAINLALALAGAGLKVGVLDADIYGPSLPRLSGTTGQKIPPDESKKLSPVEALDLKLMSMGYLVDEGAPVIWRGPMAQSALLQMWRDTDWEGLDALVIDLPPGTGDIHLTLCQKIPLSGGVVVSTPQDIALADARKGLEMFRKLNVPILGMIENMSYFCCPECGHRSHIFGHGGARDEAEKLGVPFLGEIPLNGVIRALSDAGTPVVAAQPDSEAAKIFSGIAQAIVDEIGKEKKEKIWA